MSGAQQATASRAAAGPPSRRRTPAVGDAGDDAPLYDIDTGSGCCSQRLDESGDDFGAPNCHSLPDIWLALVQLSLMADTVWCSGAIHDQARRVWLGFHRQGPPDAYLKKMAAQGTPQPLAAALWRSIKAVRALWEQPPAPTHTTTTTVAALLLWQNCTHWPRPEGYEDCRAACCTQKAPSCCRDAGLLLGAQANDYKLSAERILRWQMNYGCGMGEAKLLQAMWTSGSCPAQAGCEGGVADKSWDWERAELLLPLVLSQGLSWAALVRAGFAHRCSSSS